MKKYNILYGVMLIILIALMVLLVKSGGNQNPISENIEFTEEPIITEEPIATEEPETEIETEIEETDEPDETELTETSETSKPEKSKSDKYKPSMNDYDYILINSESEESGEFYCFKHQGTSYHYIKVSWVTNPSNESDVDYNIEGEGDVTSKQQAMDLFGESATYYSPNQLDKTLDFYGGFAEEYNG